MAEDRLNLSDTEIQTLRAATLVALFVLTLCCLVNLQWPNFSRIDSARTLLLACIFYPVCEEVIFRALLLKEFLSIKWLSQTLITVKFLSTHQPVTGANMLVSVLFAISHGLYFNSSSALIVFFPSIIFGLCFEVRKSAFPAIIIHGLYNFLGLMAPGFYWV